MAGVPVIEVPGSGVVVFRRTGGAYEIDAIDQYSRRLTGELADAGIPARYVTDGLRPLLAAGEPPAWILMQYNPFRYGRAGFAPSVLRYALDLRHRWRTPLAVMVHEAWIDMVDAKSSLIGAWQRAQLRSLLRLADAVMTSTEALAGELGGGAVHVPVATNITPIATSAQSARERLGINGKLTIGLLGRDHPSRALDYAEAAIAALAAAHGPDRLTILNLGAGAPPLRVPAGVEAHRPGELSADELSLWLWASDLMLLPLSDGVSTRRTTLMTALAHGLPVLGLRGYRTDTALAKAPDALVLTQVGDRAAFARAAVELAGNRERRQAVGEAGRQLYESTFDWSVMTARVASVIEQITSTRRLSRGRTATPRPRDIVFVAHDVGGPGGMEQVSEQLVQRLLDRGRSVTVIARTCALEQRDRLRFVRVRAPRRPFAIGYPAFFAVASALAARRGNAVLHTTGAIVANRADVSTVHYCHRAAADQVEGSRASRSGSLYRLNAAVAAVQSRAAEAWCYRPARTRLLCAVSSGVSAELERGFPAMADSIRTVPNGVDCAVFRPDAGARTEARANLGIEDAVSLALFVGGDWERKGLIHAIDALAVASGWHLAVAGRGDLTAARERARAAQSEARLHLLGPVDDMPRLYAAADAFLFPTSYEAFPLVVLEAAASGLPLLVPRVNGVEDVLRHGVNGWFITRDGHDIASRLNELGGDPELAASMSRAARAAIAGYSWQSMAEGYLSVYEEVCP
jgi:glycosyltransferase involved in cell wall biosynthesis